MSLIQKEVTLGGSFRRQPYAVDRFAYQMELWANLCGKECFSRAALHQGNCIQTSECYPYVPVTTLSRFGASFV